MTDNNNGLIFETVMIEQKLFVFSFIVHFCISISVWLIAKKTSYYTIFYLPHVWANVFSVRFVIFVSSGGSGGDLHPLLWHCFQHCLKYFTDMYENVFDSFNGYGDACIADQSSNTRS